MNILIVTTNAAELAPGHPTGTWLEEFAIPYTAFRKAGATVTVASPKGGASPIDPKSKADDQQRMDWADAIGALERTVPLATLSPGDFTALYIPGGHGPMVDLAVDPATHAALTACDASGTLIAAVCHGPAALVNAKRANGEPFVLGRRVSGFTNAEEKLAGLDHVVPFLLETVLKERGAHFDATPVPFAPHVVRDGNLITGQNPASSKGIAEAILAALSAPLPG
jgi:putative intracellular protease/amidase